MPRKIIGKVTGVAKGGRGITIKLKTGQKLTTPVLGSLEDLKGHRNWIGKPVIDGEYFFFSKGKVE